MTISNGQLKLRRRQLLCNLVDERAEAQPGAVYSEIPYSISSYDAGFRKVTYGDFANAINGLAYWIQSSIGHGENFPTLAYMGPNDLRYNIVLLAAVKAGYKMLFTSPRNSIAAHNHLFKSLDCHIMLTTSPHPPGVSGVVDSCKLRSFEIPSIDELFDKSYPHFPYNKTYEEHKLEPLVAVHSSGSTGLPKALLWNHEFAQSYIDWLSIEAPEGFALQTDRWTGTRLFNTLPPFHAGGLYVNFLAALYNQTTVVWSPSGVPPSAKLVMEGLKHTTADCALLSPPFMEEAANNPELLDFLAANLDSAFFAGGNISRASGEKITKKLKLFMVIGMSEAGVLPTIRSVDKWPTDDWAFFHFHPNAGIEFQKLDEDQYEAVVMRNPDPERTQPIFHVFPELQEWRTRDIYTPHPDPSKPGRWLYLARTDDIIVFLNGEKTNPNSMEHHIAHHPEVRSVLVAGTLRFQAALLIELITSKHLSTIERAEIIERLWPVIQEANQDCPRHARIAKSHILFTNPEKLMERAGKGTVQRQPTLKLYAAEIDALYNDADQMYASGLMAQQIVDVRNISSIESFLSHLVTPLSRSSTLGKGDDFFIQGGIDSLQTLQLTRNLKQTLPIPDLSITTIYTNPSISSLAKAISELSTQNDATKVLTEGTRREILEDMLEEYKHLVDLVPSPPSSTSTGSSAQKERIVVLTGSTGALGSYMLQVILDSKAVSHVYCLNRSSNSELLQLERCKARNLQTHFHKERVTFLTVDLSKDHFGLEPGIYETIRVSATDIIHNAWPVNFNLSLSTFKPSLMGIINIITLAAAAPHSPTVVFVSSISSVAGCQKNPLPEAVVPDILAPLQMGYAESKYLAERILDYAANKIPSLVIARIGQVAGPVNTSGLWNKHEWFPSLILSSLHLGMIPNSLGNDSSQLDWVPIDILAAILIELTFSESLEKQKGALVLHPMNPQPTSWSSMLGVVTTTMSQSAKKEITSVPFSTWLQQVQNEAKNLNMDELEGMLELNPAIKLLSFYEELAQGEGWMVADTTRAVKESKQLQQLKGIKPEWMEKWTRAWLEN